MWMSVELWWDVICQENPEILEKKLPSSILKAHVDVPATALESPWPYSNFMNY
jgi:hypothetical protein